MLFTTYYNMKIFMPSLELLEPVRMILRHFAELISLAADGAILSEAVLHSNISALFDTYLGAASFQIINPLRSHFKRCRLRTTFLANPQQEGHTI
jgi:hypothetical protein